MEDVNEAQMSDFTPVNSKWYEKPDAPAPFRLARKYSTVGYSLMQYNI